MPGKSLRVAGAQMLVGPSVAGNERRIRGFLRQAAGARADFLLTPEGSLSGYHAEFDPPAVAAAEKRVAALAKQLQVGLALGTCFLEKTGKKKIRYNQVRMYAPDGKYLGYYAKIIRTTSLEHPGTGEMKDYAKGKLKVFHWKGFNIGVLICNDMWASPHVTTLPNPHLAWQLKGLGAQVIFHSIHSGTDLRVRPFHESTVEIRARSLKIPIVEVNAAKPDGVRLNARSGLVNPDGTRPSIVADQGEQFFCCDIAL